MLTSVGGMTQVSRRTVTSLASAAGLSLPLLAACGGEDEPGKATDTGAGSSEDSSSSLANATASDIEVGGGTIFADDQVVVTQPSEGTFKGFNSTCTHQGCQVASVSDGAIHCPCHGSSFSIEDGSVQGGPASSPLAAVAISVDGDAISLA
jgi:Rieske Fe-S protein